MLQERTTYEIMSPDDVGYVGTNLVLGKHSGRHAFRDRIQSLGHTLDEETFERIFNEFIALADKKKEIYDSDIVALIENQASDMPEKWKIVRFHTSAGTGTIATATIELADETGKIHCDAATGDGPVDAVFRALERISGITAALDQYHVGSVSSGKDAQGEVR